MHVHTERTSITHNLFHFVRNQFRLDAQFQSDATLLVLSQAPIIFISNNKITRIPNKPTINNRSDCRPNVNWFGEAILRAHYTHILSAISFHRSFTRMCVRSVLPQRWWWRRRQQQRQRQQWWWWWFWYSNVNNSGSSFTCIGNTKCTKTQSLANCPNGMRSWLKRMKLRDIYKSRWKRMHKICTCTKEKRTGEEIFQKKKNCFEWDNSLTYLLAWNRFYWFDTYKHTSFLLSVSFMILSFPLHETSSLDENDYSLGNMIAVTHSNSACGAMPYMLDNFHLLAKSTQMSKNRQCCAHVKESILLLLHDLTSYVKDSIHYEFVSI